MKFIRLLIGLTATLVVTMAPVGAHALVPYTEDAPVVGDPLTRELVESFAAQNFGRRARLSAFIVQEDTGQEVVSINSDAMMQPASLMKLLTSAAALEYLGPDKTFETTVELHGEIRDRRRLFGHVLVRGGGDPSLGARFQNNRNDVTQVLRDWTQAIRRLGIREISGHIFGDDRRYEGPATAIGWDASELGAWYSAEVSALNFNENTIDILWRTGSTRGQAARWELIPNTTYVAFGSSVRTGSERQTQKMVRYFRFPESNEIRARGMIPPNQTYYDFAAIHDPARYTAWLLRETLNANGVDVRGNAFGPDGIGEDSLSSQPLVLATVTSPPLSELLKVVNGDSQNLYAEVLLREVALAAGRPGSFRGGSEALNSWLRSHRLHRSGAVFLDGSGLSTANRASARLIAGVMRHALNGPHGDVYRASLARPGERSLRNRMVGAEYAQVQPGLHVKTGYLTGVMTLAGTMQNHNGNRFVFVFMINNYDMGKGVEARDFLDGLPIVLFDSDELP